MTTMDRTLRGRVTRVDAQGAYVEVPSLGVGVEWGPCEVYQPFVLERRTELAGAHGHAVSHSVGGGPAETVDDHRHTMVVGLLAVRPGDRVVVSTVNGVKDDLVVVGRLG